MNGGLHIINDLDIFNSVGFSSAHDVNIPIQIKENTIYFDGSSVKLEDDEKFRVTFTKVSFRFCHVKHVLVTVPTIWTQDF